MSLKRTQFMKLKKPNLLKKYNAECVQDILEIESVSKSGLFKVNSENGVWSQTYEIQDVNYALGLYDEQLSFFADYAQSLNSFEYPFKLTIFNKNRNQQELEEQVMYQAKNDDFNYMRDAYNEVIKEGIVESNKGLEQKKYITTSFEAKNYVDAKVKAASVDKNLNKEFAMLDSGLNKLDGNARLQILHDFFKMGHDEEIDIENCILNGRDWKNDVASNLIVFNQKNNTFKIGDKIGKAFCINPNIYPAEIDDELIYDLSNVSTTSLISVDCIPIRKDLVDTMFEIKQNGIETDISRQQDMRNKSHNYLSDISYATRKSKENLEKMRDDADKNDQKTFWTGIVIILISSSKEELENAEAYITSVVEKRTMKLKVYSEQQREAIVTALPIGGRYLSDYMRTLFSRDVAALMPFDVREYQDFEGQTFYYGKNGRSKNPIFGNRKNLINSSGFVIGVPGSGKSFTGSKMEMASVFLNTQDDILVLDPTLEYEDIVKKYNGQYINIEPNTENHLNPLNVDLSVFSDKKQLDIMIRRKFTILNGICSKRMGEEYTSKHSTMVDYAISTLFNTIAKMPEEERFIPTLSDFKYMLDRIANSTDMSKTKRECAEDLSISIGLFVDGSLDIFNHQTNVETNNRFIAYGIRDMDEELAKVAMLIILEDFNDRIMKNFKKGKATWLYLDEFHMLLDSKYTENFIISFWKLVRKLGCIPTGITQNISILIASERTASLVSNSEFTIILKQGTSDAIAVVDLFDDVSASQIKKLSKAEKGTGLIRFGDVIIPLDNQIGKDNPLYELFNTNMHEKAAMKKNGRKQHRKINFVNYT